MGAFTIVRKIKSDLPALANEKEPFHRDGFQHTLEDWLELHGLTVRQCLEVLDRTKNHEIGSAPLPGQSVPVADALKITVEALSAAFPDKAAQVAATRENAVLRLDTAGTLPLSVPFRTGSLIMMNYRGRIGDLLTLAHEFGHALQITATGGAFVAPLTREICGFLAELALLDWLRAERSPLHAPALEAWRSDNAGYLDRHAAALDAALHDPASPYVYAWNYPIARILASECKIQMPARTQWAVYENRISVAGLATFLACSNRASPSCNRACLEFSGKLQAVGRR